MNTTKSALILVDCQNDFLAEKGALYSAVVDSLNANDVVRNINLSIASAREQGIPIIFTSISFTEDYSEMGKNPYGILATVKQAGAFVRDTWGSAIAEGINASEEDIVIQKNTMCAFKQTNLKETLDKQGINRLIFGGLVTDLCLETSIRSAYDMGYEAIALVDCMASISQAAHISSVEDNFPLFSKPMTHDSFIKGLTT
jgi:nicotinamidase-related amidase